MSSLSSVVLTTIDFQFQNQTKVLNLTKNYAFEFAVFFIFHSTIGLDMVWKNLECPNGQYTRKSLCSGNLCFMVLGISLVITSYTIKLGSSKLHYPVLLLLTFIFVTWEQSSTKIRCAFLHIYIYLHVDKLTSFFESKVWFENGRLRHGTPEWNVNEA